MIIIQSDNNNCIFKIIVNDIPYSQLPIYKHCRMIKLPEITYNADNVESESIFFPASLKVEFFLDTINLLYDTDIYTAEITLYENNEIIFVGKIDGEEIYYDPNINTYKITFVDYSKDIAQKKYNELSPVSFWYGQSELIWFSDIIRACIKSNMEIDYTQIPYNYAVAKVNNNVIPYKDMITYKLLWFDGSYETAFDILNKHLSSLGLISYIKGYKLVIKPKFQHSIKNIYKYRITEINYVDRYDYIVGDVKTGSGRQQIIDDLRLDPTKPPKKEITIKYEICGGRYPYNPGYTYVNYIAKIGNEYYFMDPNTFQIGNNVDAPWAVVHSFARERLKKRREKISAYVYEKVEMFDHIRINNKDYIIISLSTTLNSNKYKITALSI
mgnify:FL=1